MMSTYTKNESDVIAFVAMIREALPGVIQHGTNGAIVQTAERRLIPRPEQGEDAFQIFLSSGASYRFRVQQVGYAEDETGCRQCGELVLSAVLDEAGLCPECARDWWNRLTGQEQANWCKTNRTHYPYEDKGPMTEEQQAWIADLLESHPFRFAKTAVRNPHWYTLRHEWQDVGNDVYNTVNRMIREHGRTEWFGTYPWRMLDVNGFVYWNYYSTRVEDIDVLNRKPLPGQD